MTRLRQMAPSLAVTVVAWAMLVLGTGHSQSWQPDRHPMDLLGWCLVVVVAVAFALRGFSAVACFCVAAVGAGFFLAFDYPYGPVLLCVGILDAMTAASLPLGRSLTVVGSAAAVLLVGDLWRHPHGWEVTHAMAVLGWMLVPWATAAVVRDRWNTQLREHDEARRARIDAERILLATEVHDIVGHGLSVIASQAAIADHIFDKDPEQARELLRTIKGVSRNAMADVRSTINTLRPSTTRAPGQAVEVASSPQTIASLASLTDRMSDAGLEVRTTVAANMPPLTPLMDLTIYRVTQESLTNVLRHSDASYAEVAITHQDAQVCVTVTDRGSTHLSARPASGGHGLAGMADRVRSLGGTFSAGRSSDGAWSVRACLPVGRSVTRLSEQGAHRES